MASITKADLLDQVANGAGVSKKDAEAVLGSFFEVAVSSAKKGDKVAWPGFGSFQGVKKAATTARNPRTGATVKVPARTAMKFTSSSTLKESLNSKGAAKKAPAKKAAAKKTTAKKAPAKKR